MDITKIEFHKENIKEYTYAHIILCWGTSIIELLEKELSDYYRIVDNITGPMCSGELRLLIGKMFANFNEGYHLEIYDYRDNEDKYIQAVKEQYIDDPEEYIDYDISIEDKQKCNPYKDLIKLERYLSILISKDENIEEELINLYDEVCKYNSFTLFEKRKNLSSFFDKNYIFDADMDEVRNVRARLLFDYKTYTEHEERRSNIIDPLIDKINIYEVRCERLIDNHEMLYFELLNILNSIKSCTEKERIDLEELNEYRRIIDEKLKPITEIYAGKSFEMEEEDTFVF